jgi:hypothetical protein
VFVDVLLREGVATWWLAKESGWMPACRERNDCDYCEGGSKDYEALEFRRSYIVVQASRVVHEHSRETAMGQLGVENVETVMDRVAGLACTERNDVVGIWCVCNLRKILQSRFGPLSLRLIIQKIDVIVTHSLPPVGRIEGLD